MIRKAGICVVACLWGAPGCVGGVGHPDGEGAAGGGGHAGQGEGDGQGQDGGPRVLGEDGEPCDGPAGCRSGVCDSGTCGRLGEGEGEGPGEGEGSGNGQGVGEGGGHGVGEGEGEGEGGGAGDGDGPPDPPPSMLDCTPGRWELSIRGSARQARVDVPADLRPGAPLAIALHGNGDTSDNFCLSTRICDDWTGRGALSIAPYGPVRVFQVLGRQVQGAWNAYSTDPDDNEDLAFVDALVDEARRRCAVGEIYVWGHSQGGYLAFLLAMVRGDDVSGAVISAASDPLQGFRWERTPPRPFYVLIGDRDPALNAARATARWLEDSGHRVLLRELPGVGHGGHPPGYNQEILEFLLTSD